MWRTGVMRLVHEGPYRTGVHRLSLLDRQKRGPSVGGGLSDARGLGGALEEAEALVPVGWVRECAWVVDNGWVGGG